MKPLLQQYREVHSLLQLHLLQNHSLKSKLPVEPSLHHSYLKFVTDKKITLKAQSNNNRNPSPITAPPQTSFKKAPPLNKGNIKQKPSQINTKAPPSTNSTPPSFSEKKALSSSSKTSSTTPSTNFSSKMQQENNPISSKPSSLHKEPLPNSSKLFSLLPPPSLPATSFDATKKTLHQLFPEIKTKDTPPDDATARSLINKNSFLTPPVLLLSSDETGEAYLFLENLSKAIHTHLSTSKVIPCKEFEKKQQWSTLYENKTCQLILATKETFDAYGIKQASTSIPLIELKNIMSYINKPSLKRALWNDLTERLKIT